MTSPPERTNRGTLNPSHWSASPWSYAQGQAAITSLDLLAHAAETRYGVDRLPRLVPEELRVKFISQRQRLESAILTGDLPTLQTECTRMQAAWRAATAAAEAAGANGTPPETWEVRLNDGSVAIIVRDETEIGIVHTAGRKCAVYSLAEVGRLLSHFPALSQSKVVFPGALVTAIRHSPAIGVGIEP